MYFGGTILTFALPMGAFILAAVALFYLFRSRHSGPKLRYLAGAGFSSFGTREPGPVPAPPVAAVAPQTAVAPEPPAQQETAPQDPAPQETTTNSETAQATEESEE
jgi:hypothetical protein